MPKIFRVPALLRSMLTALAVATLCAAAHGEAVGLSAGSSATFTYLSTFGAAGAAEATFSLSADGREIAVNFLNTSTSNTYLSGLAFNLSPDVSITNYAFSNLPAGAQWKFAEGSGGGMGSYDVIASGKGNSNRLSPGEGGTLKLTLSTPLPQGVTLDVTLVHLTSLPDCSSQKPVGVLTKGGGGVPKDPGAPVPEPATLLLLGTGLAAVTYKKRRREQ